MKVQVSARDQYNPSSLFVALLLNENDCACVDRCFPPFSNTKENSLKLRSVISKFHMFIRRSSAEMKCSPSLFGSTEFTWYAWAFAYTLRRLVATAVPATETCGKASVPRCGRIPSLTAFGTAIVTFFICFSRTFHNFTVLSKNRAMGTRHEVSVNRMDRSHVHVYLQSGRGQNRNIFLFICWQEAHHSSLVGRAHR